MRGARSELLTSYTHWAPWFMVWCEVRVMDTRVVAQCNLPQPTHQLFVRWYVYPPPTLPPQPFSLTGHWSRFFHFVFFFYLLIERFVLTLIAAVLFPTRGSGKWKTGRGKNTLSIVLKNSRFGSSDCFDCRNQSIIVKWRLSIKKYISPFNREKILLNQQRNLCILIHTFLVPLQKTLKWPVMAFVSHVTWM